MRSLDSGNAGGEIHNHLLDSAYRGDGIFNGGLTV